MSNLIHKINRSRKREETKMEKRCTKLMNNAVYGKQMENVRNIIDIRLVSNERDYFKWTSKPSYLSHKIFDN